MVDLIFSIPKLMKLKKKSNKQTKINNSGTLNTHIFSIFLYTYTHIWSRAFISCEESGTEINFPGWWCCCVYSTDTHRAIVTREKKKKKSRKTPPTYKSRRIPFPIWILRLLRVRAGRKCTIAFSLASEGNMCTFHHHAHKMEFGF